MWRLPEQHLLVGTSVYSKWPKGFDKTQTLAVLVVKYEVELLILIYIVSKKYFKARVGLRKKKKVKTWMLSPRKSRNLQTGCTGRERNSRVFVSDIRLLRGFWIAPTNVWMSLTLNWSSVPFMIHIVSMHLTSELHRTTLLQ